MDKQTAISIIETLYPADSVYANTAEKGQELLLAAKRAVGYTDTWRDLPENVLIKYANYCIAEENRQAVSELAATYKW